MVRFYSTFLYEINSEGTGTSKLVSQLKLLPSLFKLEDDYHNIVPNNYHNIVLIIKKITQLKSEVSGCVCS